jgi:hypothetical protein
MRTRSPALARVSHSGSVCMGARTLSVFLGALLRASGGAGVGLLIGFVAGLGKAGTGWSPEPATTPACQADLAESMASVEEVPR